MEFESTTGTLPKHLRAQLSLLLATPMGTVMLDREFGVDHAALDQPMDTAITMFAAELAVKIPRYIPELQLKEVSAISRNENGTLNLKVVVEFAG